MSFLHRKRRHDETSESGNVAFPLYGRYPKMSQNTQVVADDYSLYDSCVLRNFPKQKSSHLRFLAWVAYTRKYSDSSMTDTERRTCPLLWCREVFAEEEIMLQHLYTCEHLSKGLYWCFSCQKPERVSKLRCKRCQGTPSTADRLTTVAKKIFSALGAKGVKGDHSAPTADRKVNTPKSPDGLMYLSEPPKCAQFQEPVAPRGEWSQMELPNNTISEMDGGDVFEMSASWTTSQELPDSQVAEMTGSEFAPMSSLAYPDEKSHDSWGLSIGEVSPAPPYTANPRRPSQPILPRLNTCVTCEPPRQTPSWSDIPMSATVISPLSASDRIDFGTFDVSPTDSEASGKSIFTDSGYSTATAISAWDESSSSLGWDKDCHDIRAFAANPGLFQHHISDKFPRSEPSLSNSLQVLPMTFADTPNKQPSSSSFSKATNPANRSGISERSQARSTTCADAKALVKSFSEVLQEHTQHSRRALRQMAPNLNTKELLDEEYENLHFDIQAQVKGGETALDFNSGDLGTLVDDFSRDADGILDESFDFSHFEFSSQPTPLERSTSFQQPPIPSLVPALHPSTTPASQPTSPAITKYRCHCGYVPNGEERWKASNLSRHKRTQHPGKGSKVYKCGWEGCGSTFTRSDNLREHVRKKGHEVWGFGDGKEGKDDGEVRRKRKKKEEEEEGGDEMDTALR